MVVFVLDDDADWLRVMRRVLSADGHDVGTFLTIDALERRMREGGPDVVVIDYTLRGSNGCAVARKLRATFGEACPRLVLISGRGLSIGPEATGLFDRYLRKPVRLEELKQTIRDVGVRA